MMNRSWFSGSTFSRPSGPVATRMVSWLKSARSRSGAVMAGFAIMGRRSSIQRPFSSRRFCTCMATFTTSKDGRPDAISMATLGRCCCSGICSEPTLMPVSSSNSFWCACNTSPRGDLAKLTSILAPFACFQSNWLWALARSTKAGTASVAPAAASTVRRRIMRFLQGPLDGPCAEDSRNDPRNGSPGATPPPPARARPGAAPACRSTIPRTCPPRLPAPASTAPAHRTAS